ncbi:AmmeMemoRadiSam system radical SAM enzyme [Candidatus Pacearchaeota archaeon]|nr:AmmeMemoRadiSam system radical SAM enzyme [Candidatus Pacearchaeota archaeon]
MQKECVLYEKKKLKKVRCLACAHKCVINEGKTGICGVRKNENGKLMLIVYGKVSSINVDPIEKKPLYHFLPGSYALSIGTVGCNFKCDFCQNFDISQSSKSGKIFGEEISPEEIVISAVKYNCKSIAYTYNEPAIFIEFVKDCAKLAKENGLKNILVTNGYFSRESFGYIKEYIDAVNIDLKSFKESFYNKYCGGNLKNVLEIIKKFYKSGIHVEITTLVIPGLNDSDTEFRNIAKFIASVDKKIPWHISRFFPKYRMLNKKITSKESLEKAYEIGIKQGLKNVHIGNV